MIIFENDKMCALKTAELISKSFANKLNGVTDPLRGISAPPIKKIHLNANLKLFIANTFA